jgi:magnesium transporter
MQRLSRRLPRAPVINWAQVVPVADRLDDGGALRLRVPRDKLALMQPAELARVVEQLTPQEGADLLNDLDEAQAADTIEELEDEQQGQILRAMDPERAADVLEEMEPDEAVDALSSMSQEEATDLLGRMSREDADEVQELLGYPEDSAGGLMTTYYVSVPDWASVGEVRAALRRQTKLAEADEEEDPLPDAMPEIYVVHEADVVTPPRGGRQSSRPRPSGRTAQVADRAPSVWTEGTLAGVVTLRDLVLAEPDTLISAVMHPTQVGHALDKEQDVARRIAEDDLLALPIVDDTGMLLGIVTVDDAMDVILPTSWKKRLPRVFH